MSAPRVIWLFLDGVGLGPADNTSNPLASNRLPGLQRVAGGQPWTSGAQFIRDPHHTFIPLDASLGVPGLPQSGTGQASLFTGIDCATLAGRHWGPYPHSTSKRVIAESNIFSRLGRSNRSGQFLNAYPDRFFQMAASRHRWTVTTLCCIESGVPVRTEADLRAGRALAADLTGRAWRERLGLDAPVISPAEAGLRMLELAEAADLSLFEYYLTDKAGHSRDPDRAREVLMELDAFIEAMASAFDPDRHLLVITSDHGNLEDLGTRVHTLNPVPLIAVGRGADAFHEARTITDVVPAIMRAHGA